MFDECLPMGCLSSRSTTTVSPEVVSGGQTRNTGKMANGELKRSTTTRDDQMPNGFRNTTNGDGMMERPKDNYSDSGTTSKQKRLVDIGTSLDGSKSSFNRSVDSAGRRFDGENASANEEDDFMTMLMNGDTDGHTNQTGNLSELTKGEQGPTRQKKATKMGEREGTFDELESSSYSPNETSSDRKEVSESPDGGDSQQPRGGTNTSGADQMAVALATDKSIDDAESGDNSFEEELNADLLRQYIAVDFEISQLEDRDALRLYHEKIEQLEQLERELDMISFEAEEVAVRSETGLSQAGDHRNRLFGDGALTPNEPTDRHKDSKTDLESNSILSGLSGSLSAKSSLTRRQDNQQRQQQQQQQQQTENGLKKGQLVLAAGSMSRMTANSNNNKQFHDKNSDIQRGIRQLEKEQRFQMLKDSNNNLSYATIEEVFNRKIILEKERDKLKKEVEMVIIECDRLQQKYKKRDEILDKLFDGRTGNGLENHLEQQLNWLMEQKHYVDQVFYAWKRAETLTSQTCEQFASALELLKRLPKTQNDAQRQELSKSVCSLLIKSRQDMEQAQRYNPNVDAPFFTDAETERFDKIIETIQSNSISQGEYNQMATVVQFAYKRAVSIRLWLEQILQITIARDSFELAEEYKWIAIQLRKERISLINLKLQDPPYRAIAQSIREQLAGQHQRQQQQQLDHSRQLAITDGLTTTGTVTHPNRQNEINRDSGIESDDIDIEEDIYRLLEMNKSRLEAAVAASREAGNHQSTMLDSTGRPVRLMPSVPSSTSTSGIASNRQQLLGATGANNRTSGNSSIKMSQHDQMMRERIQRRVRGEQPLTLASQPLSMVPIGKLGGEQASKPNHTNDLNTKAGARPGDLEPNSTASTLTPSKLRIQLDEESRRSLLKQVEQIHSKHCNKLDNLRGNNKAKANDILMRLQSSKQQNKDAEPNGKPS